MQLADGNIILEKGKLVTVEEESYLQEVNKYTKGIGERAANEFFAINGTNAAFMKEGKL